MRTVTHLLTTVGVVGLALGGFTLSFASLRDLAVASGLLPELAFLWPLIVDGFIVVATAAAFRLKPKGPRVTWYPWAALLGFATVSVAGNALHAAQNPDRTVSVWVATIVSAVPAVALLVASHLLVVMAEHQHSPTSPAPTPSPVALAGTAKNTPTVPTLTATPETPRDETSHKEIQPHETGTRAAATTPRPAATPQTTGALPAWADPLAPWLGECVASGTEITGRSLADELGVSDRTGRRRLEELKAAAPHLFTITEGALV